MEFCFATPADSRALLDICRQYIDTAVTFRYELPDELEFARRMEEIQLTYPFLICRSGSTVLGYACARPVRPYEAYQWGVELTIYLNFCATSSGLGTKLYGKLLALLKEQGVHAAYGCVTLPNAQSEGSTRSWAFAAAASGTGPDTRAACGTTWCGLKSSSIPPPGIPRPFSRSTSWTRSG